MEDDIIIDLYWKRSENAISETKLKYGRYCRSIAFNILSNHLDVEECENDTYTAAWNAIPPALPTKLAAFLGRLMRNIALDKLDYNKAQKRNSEFDIMLSELEDCIPLNSTVEEQYTAGETAKVINKFLRSLDTDNRIVFIRRYWYSDDIKQISARLQMSDSKIKSMLFRTRKKLRKFLEQEGIM